LKATTVATIGSPAAADIRSTIAGNPLLVVKLLPTNRTRRGAGVEGGVDIGVDIGNSVAAPRSNAAIFMQARGV